MPLSAIRELKWLSGQWQRTKTKFPAAENQFSNVTFALESFAVAVLIATRQNGDRACKL